MILVFFHVVFRSWAYYSRNINIFAQNPTKRPIVCICTKRVHIRVPSKYHDYVPTNLRHENHGTIGLLMEKHDWPTTNPFPKGWRRVVLNLIPMNVLGAKKTIAV